MKVDASEQPTILHIINVSIKHFLALIYLIGKGGLPKVKIMKEDFRKNLFGANLDCIKLMSIRR